LEVDDSAKRFLAREGFDPDYGARPLKRAVQTWLLNPLSRELIAGQYKSGQRIHVSAAPDGSGLLLRPE
jgi:ATP-dependent Clp protease ATP-binding subunit ClpB